MGSSRLAIWEPNTLVSSDVNPIWNKWTVYGKIKSITKSDGSSLEYRYDAGGNRIYKAYTHSGVTDKTWYVRDAQGNTLAIYGNKDGGSTLYWKEQELYGSSRLGIWTPDVAVGTDVSSMWDNLGIKRYELSNHLGNVLATISDKPVLEGDHYKAELLSAQDYYPFGMLQPDRSYSLGSYRYGFNGKENDNEVKGEGNQQDYGLRIYDGRLGRFLSVDPLTKSYPELTPYQFASNTPIQAVDLDGGEARYITKDGRKWMESMPSDQLRHQIPASAYMPSSGAAEYGGVNGLQTLTFIATTVFVVAKAPAVISATGRGIAMGWQWYLKGGHATIDAAMGDGAAAFGPSHAVTATGAGVAAFEIASREETAGVGISEATVTHGNSIVTQANVPNIRVAPQLVIEGEGGGMIGATVKYEDGKVTEILANKAANGKKLELTDMIFYPKDVAGNEMKNEFGPRAMLETLDLLKKYGKSEGYEQLRVQFKRAENSSSAKPGHTFDETFDLH